MLAVGMLMRFHVPGVNALELPCDSNVPGWPALSLYTPRRTVVTVELPSRKTNIVPSVPFAAAVVWKASAVPIAFWSTWLSIVVSPKSRIEGAEMVRVTVMVAGEFCTLASPLIVICPV